MPQATSQDLRVLICEDEYLLAMDMAQQLEDLSARVVGIAGSLGELERTLADPAFDANAVVLDLQFVDGTSLDIIPRLESTGAAVVVCSGYSAQERPPALAHIPWVDKPADAKNVAAALCDRLDHLHGHQRV